jgi:hypothetical protein
VVAVGDRVRRGPDWKWKDQDGGVGSTGTLTSLSVSLSVAHREWTGFVTKLRMWSVAKAGEGMPCDSVRVKWDSGSLNVYRFGFEGCYDVEAFSPSAPVSPMVPLAAPTGTAAAAASIVCDPPLHNAVR